jgi:uncharacterized protein YndB with AHSA1/START domain
VTDEHAVTVRREIAAPAEDLFDAWLDAQSLGSWLRPSGIRETRAETDPRVGGSFRIVMVDDASSLVHTGTYREIDRPRRLVFTWSSPATQFRDSIVTVTFEPSSNRSTVVEIHQVGLPDEEARASHHAGWTDVLRELDRDTGRSTKRS